MRVKLSENFYLDEFEKSQIASRHGIDNSVPDWGVPKLKLLCEHVLQPVRNRFGPAVISSGWRGSLLNKLTGGSEGSQHSKAEASDLECLGISNYDVAKWIYENCDFDQLILEYYDGINPNSGWIHCSYVGEGNRKEVLRAYKDDDNKTVYEYYRFDT